MRCSLVTGVQTCALPIYAFGPADAGEHLADHGCTLACLRRLEPCLFVVISDRRKPPTDRGWFRAAGGDFQRRSVHCPVARYGWFGAREHPKLHQWTVPAGWG